MDGRLGGRRRPALVAESSLACAILGSYVILARSWQNRHLEISHRATECLSLHCDWLLITNHACVQ